MHSWSRLLGIVSSIAFAFVLLCTATSTLADNPTPAENSGRDRSLAEEIDQHLAQLFPARDDAVCSDGQFIRRVYLDLVGTIPPAEEARLFMEDQSPGKREGLVDRLLEDPRFAKHLANVFDVMWMERRPSKYVKQDEWLTFLRTAFEQQTPINEIAARILAADGVNAEVRGPAKFYLEREVEPNLLTREVGRMFFGMDVQCAQCHDHPIINDYTQRDYHGLFAFLNRSYLFQPDTKQPAVLAEKAEGDAKFKSVFTEEEGETGPRLPGETEIDEPQLTAEQAYKVKPDPKKKTVRPVPAFSRREALAKAATDGTNDVFNRNLANRLWTLMIGRGLVHPIDQHHSDNPPVHPELLQRLADGLVQMDFDVKSFIRQIALSKTYQRPYRLPEDFGRLAEAIEQQRVFWNEQQEARSRAFEDAEKQHAGAKQQLVEAQTRQPELAKQADAATQAMKAANEQEATAQKKLVGVDQKVKPQREAVTLLSASVTQLGKASSLIPDLSELPGSIKQLQSIENKAQLELKNLLEQQATAKAEAEAAAKSAGDARAASEQTRQKLKANEDQIASLQRSVHELRLAVKRRRTDMQQAISQVARLKTLSDYATLSKTYDATRNRWRQLEQRVAEATETDQRLNSEIAKVTLAVDDLKTESAELAKIVVEHGERLETTRQAAELVSRSREAAVEAASLLARRDDLASAAATLAASQQDLAGQTESLRTKLEADKQRTEAVTRQLETMSKQLASLQQQAQSNREAMKAGGEQLEATANELAAMQEQLSNRRDGVADTLARQFSLAVLQPLSPEQLARSILDATGHRQILRQRAVAAVDKKSPLKPEETSDPAKVAAYEKAIDQQLENSVDSAVKRFVDLFAAAGGQPQDDFFATVDQALYVRNGSDLRGWLNPQGNNLVERLRAIDEDHRLADELYLSVLTRMPTGEERDDVAAMLATPELPRLQAIQEAAWALLTSIEFRFHH